MRTRTSHTSQLCSSNVDCIAIPVNPERRSCVRGPKRAIGPTRRPTILILPPDRPNADPAHPARLSFDAIQRASRS